jgi:hypothetical protein
MQEACEMQEAACWKLLVIPRDRDGITRTRRYRNGPPTLPAPAGTGFSFRLPEHTVNPIHMPVLPVYSL